MEKVKYIKQGERYIEEGKEEKNKYNLPDFCFANDVLDEEKIIIIKYGEMGYYNNNCRGNAMDYNEKIGVTRAEMEAMKAGSMFGWDVPAANPEVQEKIFNRNK